MKNQMAQLEIAVTSLEDAQYAEKGGAQSVEISTNLAAGGLTPEHSIVDKILNTIGIDVHVIVRPHPHSFVYTPEDVKLILKHAQLLSLKPIKSIVFGACDQLNRLDLELIKRVKDIAAPVPLTIHRALDESIQPEASLDGLKKMGICRVLTSGPALNAWDGRESLARWVKCFTPPIQFVVSGGIKDEQLQELSRTVQAHAYHIGAAARTNGEVDPQKVMQLKRCLT